MYVLSRQKVALNNQDDYPFAHVFGADQLSRQEISVMLGVIHVSAITIECLRNRC